MENKNRHYSASALTGRGFLSYWTELFKKINKLYLLRGNTLSGQSLTIRLLGLALADRGLPVNYFHRAEDLMILEGLIAPSRSFGVLSYNHPSVGVKSFPSDLDVIVVELSGEQQKILNYEKVERLLTQAREIHNSYCLHGNGVPLDQGTFEKIGGWVNEIPGGESFLSHYFAMGTTMLGEMGFCEQFLGDCKRRYLIKGAPGTGAVVMREILIKALSYGYRTEVFHSWIEPLNWVVVYFPETLIAVVDTTCCYRDIIPLEQDTIWELSDDRGAVDPQVVASKVQEIKICIQETAIALDDLRQQEKGSPCLKGEEINAIISRVLKETSRDRGTGSLSRH